MKSQLIFYLIIACGTASDLISKSIIFRNFNDSGYIKLFPSCFGIICSKNEGIAFGLFPNKGYALIFFTIFAVCAILYIYYRSDKSSKLNSFGLALVLSGAIGNLTDRITTHSVRDFIDIHVKTYHWPTFNVADILICVGVGLLVLRTLTIKEEKPTTDA